MSGTAQTREAQPKASAPPPTMAGFLTRQVSDTRRRHMPEELKCKVSSELMERIERVAALAGITRSELQRCALITYVSACEGDTRDIDKLSRAMRGDAGEIAAVPLSLSPQQDAAIMQLAARDGKTFGEMGAEVVTTGIAECMTAPERRKAYRIVNGEAA